MTILSSPSFAGNMSRRGATLGVFCKRTRQAQLQRAQLGTGEMRGQATLPGLPSPNPSELLQLGTPGYPRHHYLQSGLLHSQAPLPCMTTWMDG